MLNVKKRKNFRMKEKNAQSALFRRKNFVSRISHRFITT